MLTTTQTPKRRLLRFVAMMAGLALLTGLSTGPAAAAPATVYVGLGDSIAAGTGGGPSSPPCHQTPAAYPSSLGGVNVACFGATTSSVVQLELPFVPSNAALVTVTVGSNDVGAGNVAATCTNAPGSPACQAALFDSVAIQLPKLPGRIASMVKAIRQKAPSAQIVLTGYPRLFTSNPLMTPEQLATTQSVNRATDLLNASIALSALLSRARYVSVTDRFINHGVGSSDPWIVGPPSLCIPTVNCPTQPEQLFHPTATGHIQGYSAAVAASFVGVG